MTELAILVVVVAILAGFLLFGRRAKADACEGCCGVVERAHRALREGAPQTVGTTPDPKERETCCR